MSEMIRRMVTAYRASMYEQPVEIDWETRQHQAMAAAVEAMRQPTEAMISAAYARLDQGNDTKEWADDGACTITAAHKAMIDAALNPTPPTGREGGLANLNVRQVAARRTE